MTSRFDHLERARPEPKEEEARPVAPGRFGAVEQAREAAPGASGVAEGRFRAPEERLELDTPGEGALPFVRCARCRTDNNRFATRCSQCGSPFDTAEQRAFDAQLAAEHQAERERERAEAEARAQAAAEESDRLAAERRRLGELLAAEVGARERAKFGAGEGVPALADKPSLAMWLLAKIPDDRVRIAVGVVLALAPLVALKLATPRTRGMAWAMGYALVTLFAFLPPRLWLTGRRARWDRWSGWD